MERHYKNLSHALLRLRLEVALSLVVNSPLPLSLVVFSFVVSPKEFMAGDENDHALVRYS